MRGLLFGRFHKIPSVAMPALRPLRLAESTQKQSLSYVFILHSYLVNKWNYEFNKPAHTGSITPTIKDFFHIFA